MDQTSCELNPLALLEESMLPFRCQEQISTAGVELAKSDPSRLGRGMDLRGWRLNGTSKCWPVVRNIYCDLLCETASAEKEQRKHQIL